jgi:small nuclear ribonucleoprotein (snRNP)-like protein
MFQNQVFATIKKIPENVVALQNAKPSLSFKQKVFTYLIQRKIRHLAKKGNLLQECVTITLKNGRMISATIVSMDDKNIIYKRCDQTNATEDTVQVKQVAYVMDAQNRMIFNNQPQLLNASEPTKGDKNATISITSLVIALGSVLLAFIIALSSLFGNRGSFEIMGIILSFVFIIGILVSFISGMVGLGQMANTPPQKESSRFLAVLSTIISGLFVVLMLLFLANN